MSYRLSWAVLAVVATVSQVGCGKIPDVDQRWGPGPTIAVEDVDVKLRRQAAVMDWLSAAAQRRDASLSGAALWYEATLLGFNYVDEECSEYLRLNFRLSRMQKRDKGVLELLSKNSSGLLSAARVADPTITTVAAALGLGAQLTDVWLEGYLFSMEPNIVFRTVTKLQNGYRAEVERKRATVASAATAHRVIQSYYTLCFPQTIEAKMSEYLSQSVSEAEPAPSVRSLTGTGAGSVTTIDTGLKSPK
ncbi:MAG: hypothetical protein ABTQ29_06225 [Siculibacillus sp.]